MSYSALSLEDLNHPGAGSGPSAPVDEAARLQAFETGYKSGWDDANAETAASEQRIAADLERRLADLTFTYEEARAEVMQGLSGLLGAILSGFLPALAADAVIPRVTEALQPLLGAVAPGGIELVASPATASKLDRLVERHFDTDLHVRPEPAYPDGRVTLSTQKQTTEIDITDLVGTMSAAIRDFVDAAAPQEKERNHV